MTESQIRPTNNTPEKKKGCAHEAAAKSQILDGGNLIVPALNRKSPAAAIDNLNGFNDGDEHIQQHER